MERLGRQPLSWVVSLAALLLLGCQVQSGSPPPGSATSLATDAPFVSPVTALDSRGGTTALVIADGRTGEVLYRQDVGDGAAATAWRQAVVAVAVPAIDHTSARITIQQSDGQRVSEIVARPFPQYPGVLRFKPLGFTGDGRYLVAQYVEAIGGIPVSWGYASWSVADGTEVGTVAQEDCGVANIVSAPESMAIALCLGSGELVWFDGASASVTASVRLPGESEGYRRQKGDQVFGPAIIGDRVFAATEAGDVLGYDLSKAGLVAQYKIPLPQLDRVVGIASQPAGIVLAIGSRESQGLSDTIDRLFALSKETGEVVASRELEADAAFLVSSGDGVLVVPFPSGAATWFGGAELTPASPVQFSENLISAPFAPDGL